MPHNAAYVEFIDTHEGVILVIEGGHAHVFCLGCGGTFPADANPYPLTNGMCAPCVREARAPTYRVLAENERLRERLRDVELYGEKLLRSSDQWVRTTGADLVQLARGDAR